MADAGIRIDRSSPILQNPDLFSRSPLKKRTKDEEQVSSVREKRVRENQETSTATQTSSKRETPTVSRKRKREDDGELLPQVKRARTELPEKAETNPNFNRNVWSSAKRTQGAEQTPMIAMHRAELPISKPVAIQEDPLLHMPKLGGYYVAKIVGSSYELHMTILENQFEVFKVTHGAQERLRDEKLDLIKEQIANGKIQAEWSYWKSALEYFSITGQAAVGTGLLMTGNIPGGAAMLGGSALSLSGKLLRDRTDYYKTGVALSLAGGVTSAYAGTTNLAAVGANNLPGKLSTATELMNHGATTYIEQERTKAQASQLELKGKDVMNGHKQELNKQEMDKVIGSFATSHPEKTLAAATKVMETEHRIKSDIVAGDKV